MARRWKILILVGLVVALLNAEKRDGVELLVSDPHWEGISFSDGQTTAVDISEHAGGYLRQEYGHFQNRADQHQLQRVQVHHLQLIHKIDSKNGGKEKQTTTAKRVDKLVIGFDVDNRIAQSGQTDVYVAITGPDGKPVTVEALGSGTFTSRDEGEKFYTAKVPVQIEAGKKRHVEFAWKQNSKFQPGAYKIEIYHNGFKIGEATRDLKKGGLFS